MKSFSLSRFLCPDDCLNVSRVVVYKAEYSLHFLAKSGEAVVPDILQKLANSYHCRFDEIDWCITMEILTYII